jgi:hypothetical protein
LWENGYVWCPQIHKGIEGVEFFRSDKFGLRTGVWLWPHKSGVPQGCLERLHQLVSS